MLSQSVINRFWYTSSAVLWPLMPLAWLYRWITNRKRQQYLRSSDLSYRAPCPVIVVGNVTVGGTGKTPLTLYLIKLLQQMGYQPGIVSRGYKSEAAEYPHMVSPEDSPRVAGDEPLMLSQLSAVPVCIDANRPRAIQKLLQDNAVNIVISDDGLQHYAMARDIELVVVDGERGYGNGYCLPVGPLRESLERLTGEELIVVNGPGVVDGYTMNLKPESFTNLATNSVLPLNAFEGRVAHVYAAIGNPGRFYAALEALGVTVLAKDLSDHHGYSESDFDQIGDDEIIIMTEKDAVKCRAFADQRFWCLPVEAQLPEAFDLAFVARLKGVHETR